MDSLLELKNDRFVIVDYTIILIIAIVHFVFGFYIRKTDFQNIFDSFESSPLFDFSIGTTCDSNSHIIFHTWEGREEKYYYYKYGRYVSDTRIVDVTDITKINGYLFCYKYISYKDLLYNGQIIKKGETCPQEYQKNCGILDTLEQELCIKNEDKCPLYDVGIGQNTDTANYISKSETEGNVYYNNEDYNDPNKRIIGKLFLNEGQPCYRLNEKKWRTFLFEEAGAHHLECELEVFGKFEDDRYSHRGDITYYKLYEDNLGHNFNRFDDEKEKLQKLNVSLYKREFLGIDKSCDEETNIDQDNYTKLRKNQDMEQTLLLTEAIIILFFSLHLLLYPCISCCCPRRICFSYDKIYNVLFFFIIICLIMNLICIICQAVFLGRIIKYDLSYDCSDEKTNEVLRLENLNTKNSIKYITVNLGIDIFYILFNIFGHLIIFISTKRTTIDLNISKNKEKKANYKNDNDHIIDFRGNDNNKEPIKEVIVNNENLRENEKPLDNDNFNINLNNNNNYDNEPNTPFEDLGVPPAASPGFSSDVKL